MAVFQFEPGFQRGILRLMQVDSAFCMRAIQHVNVSFFTVESLGWVFRVFQQYWKDYQQPCGDIALRGALRYVPETKAVLYYTEVEQIIALGRVADAEYVRAQLSDFCRRNLFAIAHQESARLFNDQKTVEAYDTMAKAQDEIRKIDFTDNSRQWFFEELVARQRQRFINRHEQHAFATGIGELDSMASGGVQAGEVWAVLAYAKRCKTTWLCNQGFRAVRMHGATVLHVVLEGQKGAIPAKYDTLFSDELYSLVKIGEIDSQRYAAMQAEYLEHRKRLVVRVWNDWDVTIEKIVGEIDELRVSHDFSPELLILDYVDLLRSRYRVDSETQHQVEASRDLKRLVNDRELACWTAWQAQRPKPNANTQQHVLTSASVADAYAKVRIVDSYGSLNATDEEMQKSEMRVYWEAAREGLIGKCWTISNDLSRSRMVTEVIAAETEPTTMV